MNSGIRKIMSVATILAGGIVLPASVGWAADYVVVPATKQTVGDSTTVGGTVVPYKEVTLAAQIPGEVNFIAGREGDTFTEGALLVSIDDEQIQAQRRAATAAMISAQSAWRNAQVQYSRELWSPRTGKPTGMGLPSMMDSFMKPFSGQYAGGHNPWVQRYADLHGQARTIEDAQTRILEARAKVEELDAKLKDARLHSPFDGVIIAKLVEIGDTVQPGQPMLKFAHVTFLRIQAEVPVRLVPSLRKGMMVPARLDVGSGVDVQARVAQIFPMADRTRHTVTVKFDLPKGVPGGPGMYADVNIPDTSARGKSLPTVPRSAVFRRGSLPAVYVLENNKPSLRLVRVGAGVGSDRVSILSGLTGDEQIIVDPSSVMREGGGQ